MDENIKYYVVKQKALPEVLLKVAQANRLIETKGISVADATEQADFCMGICSGRTRSMPAGSADRK